MNVKLRMGWSLLVAAPIVSLCVLGFYQTTTAQQPQREDNIPFANAVEQRFEMINQLKEINLQLKELNTLLRSGKLRVVTDNR